nr:E-beta-farnesene synthase [Tanacetum cinerariifolium]
MADINAPSSQAPAMAPPVRTDDQILPRSRWVPIGKSNCYLDLKKSQSNPIYKIVVDLLKYTNFFRAFTASSTILSIYIQQFWDTVIYDKTAGCYRCQLDEQWAPVLQTIWGVVTRTHIDYAERIWEEFTQSIHTFIEDKRNLSRHISGQNKATLIVIPSIRFTKLIIHHFQRRHKFHPRPDSPLHLPNEEPVLGYIKFSAKGTKREVFGMPIPGSLITADIREASYYQEYLANVAKHQRYLAGETGSKKHTLKSVVESVAKDAPAKEPQVAAEDADLQKALKESMKSVYDVPQGPLPPVSKIEESEKVVPGADEGGEGEGQAGLDPGAQAEGQMGSDAGAQDKGQAGSNPDENSEGQARPDPKQLDEGFTATAYPKVQENLKLTVEEHVLLEEPASSSGTLSSLQHLSKDISFGDLFISDKPLDADNDKANAKTEVESMVTVTIQQDMSSIPPMTSLIIDLTSRPEFPKVHLQLKATTTETTTTITTTTLPPPPDQRQSTTEAMMMKLIGELKHIIANLI